MEIYAWVIISSVIIFTTGYCINAFVDRRHEITLKRIEFRLETLNSFLPIFLSIQQHKDPFSKDPALLPNLQSSRLKFQIYGKNDEVEIFESMIEALEARSVEGFLNNAKELIDLIRCRIREELELNL